MISTPVHRDMFLASLSMYRKKFARVDSDFCHNFLRQDPCLESWQCQLFSARICMCGLRARKMRRKSAHPSLDGMRGVYGRIRIWRLKVFLQPSGSVRLRGLRQQYRKSCSADCAVNDCADFVSNFMCCPFRLVHGRIASSKMM